MKSYLLLGVLSVLAAEPALAQYRDPFGGPSPYGYRTDSPRQRIAELTRRIDSSERFRIISPQDARDLRRDVERLRRVEWEYGHDGLSSWERSDLARQINRLRDDVLAAEQGRFGGGVIVPRTPSPPPTYRDDRGTDDRYDDRDAYRQDDLDLDLDHDRDGLDEGDDTSFGGGVDDRDEDANAGPDLGQPDNEDSAIYEPGGGYPDQLNVGDRAPANLGLLPPELQGRYRDGSGVYYRYWNGTIYQIDDRTGTIRWIGRPWD